MTIEDYDEPNSLWRLCGGVGLSSADCREVIESYSRGIPGLSLVAHDGSTVAGPILCEQIEGGVIFTIWLCIRNFG